MPSAGAVDGPCPDRLHLSAEEVRALRTALADDMGEGILRRGEDPDFETVAACCPPLKYPREAAGVKEHPFEFVVEPDGSVSLPEAAGGEGEAFFETGTPPARFGRAPYACTKRLEGEGLPIITASTRAGKAVLKETIFGWSEGMHPEKALWAYLRLAVRNQGETPWEEAVRFRFQVEGEDRAPGPGVRLRVPPGSRKSVCLRLRYDTADPGIETLEEGTFQARLAEVISWWKACLARGMKVRVPEARVNEAWRAWLAWNFMDVDLREGIFEPHDGAGFYEAVFDYSAALYCHALDLWGFHAEAGQYLDSLFSLVEPGGPFFVNYGLPGTGALLFAAAEHYRLTGDRAWLEAAAPRLIGLCDWISARRRKTIPAAGEEKKEPPLTAGLIRFTPYADYPEETVDYYGDTYCCTGMEAAAAVLREIGREPAAARLEREAAAYRRDILASMDRAVIRRFGAEILPMEPDTHRLLRSTGYRAGGYYGLIASMMLESGFLPPGGPRAGRVTAFMERWGGLTLGMCAFGDGVDHAYTYGYWMDALRRGAVKRVLLGFYGTLACGMSRTTYCGVEVTRLRTGENTPTTPHLYSGTQQLRLLRMMLLREEGKTLVIGSGVPRHWLRPGDRIEVEGAPTRFGPCAFRIEVREDRVLLKLTAPNRRPPAAVRIILRRPGNLPIRSVEVNGRPLRTFEGDRFTLEEPRGDLGVEVGY